MLAMKMNDEITKDEELMLGQVESMGKWDSLFQELVLFIPCAIIITLGACYDSKIGVYLGLATYAVIRFWLAYLQCLQTPTLKSAITKLRERSQQIGSLNSGSASAPSE